MWTSEAETVNNSIRWPTNRTSGIKYNYAFPGFISMKMFVRLYNLNVKQIVMAAPSLGTVECVQALVVVLKNRDYHVYDLEPRAEVHTAVPRRSPNKELNLLEILLLAKHRRFEYC